MLIEPSSLILILASGAVSFALGRTYVHFRDKKRRRQAQERQALAEKNRVDEPESRNKAKRKRQMRDAAKR